MPFARGICVVRGSFCRGPSWGVERRSGRGGVGGWEVAVVEGEGGAHEALAVGGDAVQALLGHFRDEAVAAERGEQAGDAGTAAASLLSGARRLGVEAPGEVGVAEADDRVLAGERGAVEGELLAVEGVEPRVASSPVCDRPGVPVEHGDAVAGLAAGGEGVQVALVGGAADLVVAAQVGDAFAHRAPDVASVLAAEDTELAGVVDRRLDAEYVRLVVELDRVGGHAVFDPPAL